MNKPTFRVVKPWFRIFLSLDKKATMSAADAPGVWETYSMISFFNRSNRAFFCEPFPCMVFSC